MFTLSNGISFLRAPLGLFFIWENTTARTIAIILAMVTDCIDGYLARRYRSTSRFGTILDPLMDKFFVFSALIILFLEKHITPWQIFAMTSRDFFLCLFGIYISLFKMWKTYELKAIRWGKITTAMQFCTLIALVCKMPIPPSIYSLFILFGLFAFIELILRETAKKTTT